MRFLSLLMVLGLCAACLADVPSDQAAFDLVNARFHTQLKASEPATFHPPAFPGVVVIASFANDRGYAPGWVVQGGEAWALDSASAPVLEKAGWKSAAAARRLELGRAWVEQVRFHWKAPLHREPDAFSQQSTHSWSDLTAQSLADGGVQVDCWIQQPAGMVPVHRFSRLRCSLDAAGRESLQVLEEWSAPIPGAHR